MLDQDLLKILACPKCKGGVKLDTEQNGLLCLTCRLRYEVRNGIPVMLIDEAMKID